MAFRENIAVGALTIKKSLTFDSGTTSTLAGTNTFSGATSLTGTATLSGSTTTISSATTNLTGTAIGISGATTTISSATTNLTGTAITISGGLAITNTAKLTGAAVSGVTAGGTTTGLLAGSGTEASPTISSNADSKFFSFYTQSSSAGGTDQRGIYWSHTLAGAGASGEAVRSRTVLNATGGVGVHGIHSTAAIGASGTVTGQIAGLRCTLEAADATRSLGGTGCALLVDSYVGTGNTLGGRYSMIRLAKAGAVDVTNFLDVSDDQCLKGSAASGAATDALPVLMPNGSTLYLSLIAAS